ncbi:hypothetical protein PPROV_000178100 [Pycnococcus provasolii]|uniref:Uncharacterized protein n=1 Tax=Pycnococcus provasolii TaxID=41880 RepID=A0A830H719_9CHLO|nr:hypothetical protein PPROV_000178100 [Pycnococcus provasolii]
MSSALTSTSTSRGDDNSSRILTAVLQSSSSPVIFATISAFVCFALAGMDSFRPSAKSETASSQEAYVEELLKSSKGISGIEASPNKGIKGEAERKTNRMVAPPQNKSEEEKAKEAKEASKKPAAAAAKPAKKTTTSSPKKASSSSSSSSGGPGALIGGAVVVGAAAVLLAGNKKEGGSSTPKPAAAAAAPASAAAAAEANAAEAKEWIDNWKAKGASRSDY